MKVRITTVHRIVLGGFSLSLLLFAGCGGDDSSTEKSLASKTKTESEAEDLAKDATWGLELGEYRIQESHTVEGQKSKLGFTLYAAVPKDAKEDCQRLLENRQQKVRDQVILASRMMPLEDFDDPELARLRRRILLRLHRILPELLVQDVYFSDFSYTVDRSG